MTENNPEQVTVTDKRRIDPETGEVRHVPPGGEPGGTPGAFAGETPEEAGKAAELLGDLQRVQADFANYRKRALRDQQAATDRAKAAVVSQLLGVLDDLDRARRHGDLESGPLKSVADKLDGALSGLGLTAFGAEGEDFDPVLHEAVQHEGDGGEGSRPVIGTSCATATNSVTTCCGTRWYRLVSGDRRQELHRPRNQRPRADEAEAGRRGLPR